MFVDPNPNYEDQVFVNCPFDEHYARFSTGIVFAIHDCGFIARSALESVDSSEVRIERIMRLISECSLGLHDLSRTELDPINQLPRFNMPLELGIFLGAKRFGEAQQQEKSCLILDREPYRYQKFCSDISGQDISSHDGNPSQAVEKVRNWLSSMRPTISIPSGTVIWAKYEQFEIELPEICADSGLDHEKLTFSDYTDVIIEWLGQFGS